MNELESRLSQEESGVLQHKIRTNSLNPEATEIAVRILHSRGENVPVAETSEEEEERWRFNDRQSLIALVLTLTYLLVLLFGNITATRFIVFTLVYGFTLRYTFRKIRK